MARRFSRNQKTKKQNSRAKTFKTKNQIRFRKVKIARKHVLNLADHNLTDDEYILLAKRLKFVPTPKNVNAT